MKKVTKSFVAILALVAMLTQNAFGVYAQATAPEPIQVENEYVSENAEPTVEVTTEEASANTQESNEGDMAEPIADTSSEPVDAALDVENLPPTDDVNYDDQIMLIDDTAEVPEEGTDVVAEEPVTEEVIEEEIPEQLDIYDNQISGSGLDELEVYVDTARLETGDSFRIIFTGPDSARFDTRLNDNLDTSSQGIYRFVDLNKEGFNIRATSEDKVEFEYTSDNGMPVIKAISVEDETSKILDSKKVTYNGEDIDAVFGEGYRNFVLDLDTKDLMPEVEYTLYVDTEADVKINGEATNSITGNKELSTIELSDLNKKQFTVYVVENEGFEIDSNYTSFSKLDGKVLLVLSGDKVREKVEYVYEDSDVVVTATLQYAEAIPDDAEFKVTPIKDEAAVEAYLGAANNGAEGEEAQFTEDNSLLYDIAFIVDKRDDEGNVIEGEKVEFEPEVGSVTVDIVFKKSQLSEELGVEEEEDVMVMHLPLKEGVKDDDELTSEKTDISASDILVENIDVKAAGNDEITIALDSFSVILVWSQPEAKVEKLELGDETAENFLSRSLDDGVGHGIIAKVMNQGADVETSYYVDELSLSGGKSDQTWGNTASSGNNDGYTNFGGSNYVGSFGSNVGAKTVGIQLHSPGSTEVILGETAYNQWNQVQSGIYSVRKATQTDKTAASVISSISDIYVSNSDGTGIFNKYNEASFEFESEKNASTVDLLKEDNNGNRLCGDGVYVTNFKGSRIAKAFSNGIEGPSLVKMELGKQLLIVNVHPTEDTFYLGSYKINGYQVGNYVSQKTPEADLMCQSVVFNFGNWEGKIKNAEEFAGVVIAPNASFEVARANCAGVLVCNRASNTGGEWHYHNHKLPKPGEASAEYTFKLKKSLIEYPNSTSNELSLHLPSYDDNGNVKQAPSGTTFDFDTSKTVAWPNGAKFDFIIEQVYATDSDKSCYTSGGAGTKQFIEQGKSITVSSTDTNSIDAISLKFNWLNDANDPNNDYERYGGIDTSGWGDSYRKSDNTIKVKCQEYVFRVRESIPGTEINNGVREIKDSSRIEEIGTVNERVWSKIPDEFGFVNDKNLFKMYRDKETGIVYIDSVRYLKVFVNYYEGKDNKSLRKVEIEENWSNNSTYCAGSPKDIMFYNSYKPIPSKGSLKVEKVLVGPTASETFRFIVKKVDGTTETKVGDVHTITPGSANAVEIVNLDAGTYKIVEVNANGVEIANNEILNNTYKVTYESQNVNVVAGVTGDSAPKATIKNTKIKPASISLDGLKIMSPSGYKLSAGEFKFKITGSTGAPMPKKNGETVTEVTNAEDGTFDFGEISYDASNIGTHTYTISEDTEYNKKNTVSPSNTTPYTLNVVVAEKNGEITAKPTLSGNTNGTINGNKVKVNFTNTFAQEVPLSFEAQKKMAGTDSDIYLKSHQFTFVLSADDATKTRFSRQFVNGNDITATTPLLTSNGSTATAALGDQFTFTQADLGKTYTFYVSEKHVTAPGLTCDTNEYTITIAPTAENGVMSLNQTVAESAAKITTDATFANNKYTCSFENTYYAASGSAAFKVYKHIGPGVPANAEFSFSLYKGTDTKGTDPIETTSLIKGNNAASFNALPYTLADVSTGKFIYTVKEEIPKDAVLIDDAFVTANGGKFEAYKGNKYLNGVIYDTSEKTFKVTVDDNAHNGTLNCVVMDASDNVINVNGDPTQGDRIYVAEFTNDYKYLDTKTKIKGKKILINQPKNSSYNFTFKVEGITDNAKAKLPSDVDENGEITVSLTAGENEFSFGTLSFDSEGSYEYKISEVDDGTENIQYTDHYYILKIDVVDDKTTGQLAVTKTIQKYTADGTEIGDEVTITDSNSTAIDVTFTNTYVTPGEAPVSATKTISGSVNGKTDEGAFLFGIYTAKAPDSILVKNGITYLTTNSSAGSLNVAFDNITYDYSDIKNMTPEASGDYDGTYKFTYYIHELSTQDELDAVTGEYAGKSILPGYNYDPNYYQVDVYLEKTDDGIKLKNVVYENDSISIDNKYIPKSGSIVIPVTKQLLGSELRDTNGLKQNYKFKFTLTPDAANPGAADRNDAGVGFIEFAAGSTDTAKTLDLWTLTYDKIYSSEVGASKVDTYWYTVEESVVDDTTNGVAIDNNLNYNVGNLSYRVKVEVSETAGQITATPHFYNGNAESTESNIVFTNSKPDSKSALVSVGKSMLGRPMTDSDIFDFTLTEVELVNGVYTPVANGTVLHAQNAVTTEDGTQASSTVNFDPITYELSDATAAGHTFVYEITEDHTGITANDDGVYIKNNVTYDTHKVYAYITVTKSGNDFTVTGPTYSGNTTFVNEYKDSVDYTFSGTKKLYAGYDEETEKFGREIKDLTNYESNFKFSLVDNNPRAVDYSGFTITNDKEGNIVGLPTITLNNVDIYGDATHTARATYDAENDCFYMYYTLSEVACEGENGIIKDDDTIYDIIVTIEKKPTGELKQNPSYVVYKRGSTDAEGATLLAKIKNILTGTDSHGILFKNAYDAEGKLLLKVKKNLVGKDWDDTTTFSFDLSDTAGLKKLWGGKDLETVEINSDTPDATESFGEISYKLSELPPSGTKIFEYTITEDATSKIPGWTYCSDEKTSYTIKVTVSDNYDGTLDISATVDDVAVNEAELDEGIMVCDIDAVEFTNSYMPTQITGKLEGIKALIGKTLTEDFSFTIAADNDEPLPEETTVSLKKDSNGGVALDNAGLGSFEFGPITFTPDDMWDEESQTYLEEKDFNYIITEVIPDDAEDYGTDGVYKVKDDIRYYALPIEATITVTDVNGQLVATQKTAKTDVKFINYFNSENSDAFAVQKIVNGTSATDKTFKFVLKSLTALDPNRPATPDSNGDYIIGNPVEVVNGGIEKFETLTFTSEKVQADAEAQGKDYATYEYEICELDEDAADMGDDYYSGYTLSKQVYVATLKATVTEGIINFEKTVVETADVDGNDLEDPNEYNDGTAVITNSFEAANNVEVTLNKTLTGRDIAEEDSDRFHFVLKAEDGTELDTEYPYAVTASTGEKNKNSFVLGDEEDETYFTYKTAYDEDTETWTTYDEITPYYYTIEEVVTDEECGLTPDGNVTVVAVLVKNDSTETLQVEKLMKNFVPAEGTDLTRFRATVLAQVKNQIDAKVNAANAEGSTDTFTSVVNELKRTYTATTSEIVNEYTAEGNWDPNCKKVLSGKTLDRAKMFQFKLTEYKVKKDREGRVLYNADGEVLLDGELNSAIGYNGGANNEKIVFDEGSASFLHYGLDDLGLHVYKISEIVPTDKKDKLAGVDYSTEEYTFHVTVKDNGDGSDFTIECPEQTEKGDVPFTFTNHISADGYVDIYGTKVLEGAEFADMAPFKFGIKETTEGRVSAEVIVENNGSSISFEHTDSRLESMLTYHIEDENRADLANGGIHTYEIREITESGNGLECDGTVYTVTVEVKESAELLAKNVSDKADLLEANIIDVSYPMNGGALGHKEISADKKAPCFSFKNKFEAKADVIFKGVKHLRIAEFATEDIKSAAQLAGKFNFKIYKYTNPERTGKATLVASTSCDGDGNYTLLGPTFTQEDLKDQTGYKDEAEFYYQIVEDKTTLGDWNNGIFTGINGVVYDNTVYNVDLIVKKPDQGSDKLKIEVKDHDNNNAITAVADAKNVYTIGDTASERAARPDGIGYFDFKNIKPQDTSLSGEKEWRDVGVAASSRPDVYIDLKSSEDNFTRVIDTYVIKAPATSYEFTGLPYTDKFGKVIEYRVSERPIAGYYSQQVGNNFINTAGELLIEKVSAETGLPLAGAELVVLDASGNEVDRWVSEAAAHVVDVKKLTAGAKYTLHEVSAPDGYGLAHDQEFTYAIDKLTVVTMEDPRIIGSVKLRKVDAETREALSGAEFALYTESGDRVYASGSAGSYVYSPSSSNGRFAVNASGELEITRLPYGSYYFVEVAAPAGYALSTERHTFSVLTDGSVAEVTVLNTKETGSVRLRKTNADGSVSLAGAVFELYAKTPTTVSSAIAATIYSDVYYLVGTYTTDASGMIEVGDLPWDDYYFVEVEAPAGYEVNTDVNGDPIAYTFRIGTTGTAMVSYDLGRITNSTTPPDTPVVPSSGGEVRGERRPTDTGRRSGGVLSGVLGVRAAPKAGVLGERLGPVTGDAFNIFLWTLLLLASIGSIIAVAIANARRKKNAR